MRAPPPAARGGSGPGISFAVERGELFGLLGPNGAGKTTTIKMLITLLLPTEGSARVLGYDVVDDPREVRRRIGYVFGGDLGLYERLSALRQPALLRRALRRLGPRAEAPHRRGARARRPRRPREGARRGLLARDEAAAPHRARASSTTRRSSSSTSPRSASTPWARATCGKTIGTLVQSGKTVLLTTHYMFEADTLCDRVAVIAKGRIVGAGHAARAEEPPSPTARSSEVEAFGIDDLDAVKRLRGIAGRHVGLGRGPRAGAGADDPVAPRGLEVDE